MNLNDKIAAAERIRQAAQDKMVEMSYKEMCDLFRAVEHSHGGTGSHVNGFILMTEGSYDRPLPEKARTYEVSSWNDAFQPNKESSAIESTMGIRLDLYMADEKGGVTGLKIEKCYMRQQELNKAKAVISHNQNKDNQR